MTEQDVIDIVCDEVRANLDECGWDDRAALVRVLRCYWLWKEGGIVWG